MATIRFKLPKKSGLFCERALAKIGIFVRKDGQCIISHGNGWSIALSHYRIIALDYEIQPVPEKIRHEMVIEIQI